MPSPSRRHLLITNGLVASIIGIHVFWLLALFDTKSMQPNALWSLLTAPPVPNGAAFDGLLAFGPIAANALLPILLTETFNWVALPWLVGWMGIRIWQERHHLRWYERGFYGITLGLGLLALVTMWSPVGQAIVRTLTAT